MTHAKAGPPPTLNALPLSIGGWEGEDLFMSGRIDSIIGADAMLNRRYRGKDGSEVWLYVSYFSGERSEGIHSPKNCLPGAGWKVASAGNPELEISGRPHKVTRLLIRQGRQSQDLLYWMHTPGGVVGDEYGLKWDEIRQALRGRAVETAFVRYNAALSDSSEMRDLIGLLDGPLSGILATTGLK